MKGKSMAQLSELAKGIVGRDIKAYSNVQAIQAYFKGSGPDVKIGEMKNLTPEDRQELGDLARAALLKDAGEGTSA